MQHNLSRHHQRKPMRRNDTEPAAAIHEADGFPPRGGERSSGGGGDGRKGKGEAEYDRVVRRSGRGTRRKPRKGIGCPRPAA